MFCLHESHQRKKDLERLFFCYMTKREKRMVENLREDLIATCNRLNIPRPKKADGSPYMGRLKDNPEYTIKYNRDIGYFVMYGERGVYSMVEGFPESDREKAKQIILKEELRDGGFQYELESRELLKEQWARTYKVEYDSRKAAFEYVINMLVREYNSLPEDLIAHYTGLMNRWFNEKWWYFDPESMTFEEKITS